jgi:DNA repair exonuclease SbcCD ATPase subunit
MSQREPNAAGPTWAEDLARRLEEQRGRMRTALEEHRKNASEWETSLQQQLVSIQQALQVAANDTNRRSSEISSEEMRLTDHVNDLNQHRAAIESVQQTIANALAEVQQREAALAKQLNEAAAAQAQAESLRKACDDCEKVLLQREEAIKQRELESAQQSSAVQQREQAVAQAERALRERETETAKQAQHLKLAEQRTRSQRVAIAHEMRARRKELLADAQRQQVEAAQAASGDESTIALQLAEAKVELTKLRTAEESHVHAQLVLEQKLDDVKRELQEAVEQLKAAESRSSEGGGSSGDSDELQQRLEMALADVKDLKARNNELTEELAQVRTSGAAASSSGAGGALDWEARKQQLLAQLESDFDSGDPQQKAAKLTVESAIQRTEEVVSAKNQEIAELQRLLSEQSGNIGGVAIGAAAIAEMLDADELIRQERENLRDIQEKLREQLKQAEIDLSVERAKIARERAILEEKQRQYDEQKQSQPSSDDPADKSKKGSNRGRWLQRLGLRDEEK